MHTIKQNSGEVAAKMENPGQLIRRAMLNRGMKGKQSSENAQPVTPDRPPQPQHKSSHSSYSALMRSHDRVRTRHLYGQSRAANAYNEFKRGNGPNDAK